MIVAEVFKVYLYPDPLTGSGIYPYDFEDGEDITSGILNVNIIQGTDLYQGPQQQIDTGQFTIVSRNPNLDPKINPNLKYNSRIKFYDERTGEFFRGYVTDVQVEYQRNDDPIITITGTDIFGAMQRVVIDQGLQDAIMALSDGPTWNGLTFTEFIDYMSDFTSKYLDLGENYIGPPGYPIPWGFWFESTQSFGDLSVGNLAYAPAKYIPQVGETYLDVINKYAQTNLISFSAKSTFGDPMSYNFINVSNFAKYNASYWTPQQDPMLQYTTYDFSSDPVDAKPYQSILLNNGYNRVINQTEISNEYRFVEDDELKSQSESFTRISSDSIEDYAISNASISTIYPDDPTLPIADWADGYSQNIFQVTQYPGQEIQQITFDNARYEDVQNESSYSDYILNQLIRIKHQINDNETIDRIYDIAGISHNISPENWEMTFTLKPNAQEVVFNYQGSLPILTMNATSGDANFNFTATIGSVDPESVSSITWALSSSYPLYPEYPADSIFSIYPYALNGNMFKNGIPRTGFTQTWNFDDDGILAPYSFIGDDLYENPGDNRYGGYGPGYWYVYAFITLTNGFTIVLTEELTVGTPEVEADFGWTQNLTNSFGQVGFVDTSVNNETGEVDSYAWDFGDGNTSALQNPTHLYNPGPSDTEYEVSLTVFAYGEDEEKVYNTHTETVTLVQPEMVPDFTFVANYQTVTFTNTSTNVGFEEPDAYLWDFGDGTTSTLKNPVHTFPVIEGEEETFSVTLTTRNIWEQTENVTKSVTVTGFNTSGTLPISQVRLTIDPFVALRGLTTTIQKPLYPYMFDLKARTSFTQNNLIYLAPTTAVSSNLNGWLEADGTAAEVTTDQLNLTRDSSITPNDQYGLSPISNIPTGAAGTTQTINFSLTTIMTNPTQFIKDILLTFRDVGTTNNINYPLSSSFLNRIHVEVPDSFGGWVRIGYFQLNAGRVDETQAAGQITQAVKTMTTVRPMPMNIPYFKYTIVDKTVTFQSMETGASYAWDFGDGTTSTSKDPVKTYTTTGTKTVSLTVTFADSSTRTTTEPVIVEGINTSAVRYIIIEQPLVDSTTAGLTIFNTPTLTNLSLWDDGNKINSYTTPTWGDAFNEFINDGGTWHSGTTTTPPQIGTSSLRGVNILTQTQLTDGTGVRVRGSDSGGLNAASRWRAIVDFKQPINDIDEIKIDAGKFLATPSGNPPANGPTYNVYSSTYIGDNWLSIRPIDSGSWTLIGTITPSSMSSTAFTTYTMTPV
jgi:PKD repeat protein